MQDDFRLTIDPEPVTPTSLRLAKQAQLSEQAHYLARERLRMLAPNGELGALSQADHEDVLEATEAYLVETERDGPYAMQRRKAEEAAAEHLRMRLSTDWAERPNLSWLLQRLPGHFRASLRCYRAALTTLEPDHQADKDSSWWKVTDNYDTWYFCPGCFPDAEEAHQLPPLMPGRFHSAPGKLVLEQIVAPARIEALSQARACHRCGVFADGEVE